MNDNPDVGGVENDVIRGEAEFGLYKEVIGRKFFKAGYEMRDELVWRSKKCKGNGEEPTKMRVAYRPTSDGLYYDYTFRLVTGSPSAFPRGFPGYRASSGIIQAFRSNQE